MSLPDLALQIIYGRLAWGLVAAAMLLAVLPSILPRLLPAVSPDLTRRSQATLVAATLVLMLLPGAASPAYWLILVFQYPSGLLLGCSLVSLYARWQDRAVSFSLPAGIALPLAVGGLLLYLDAFGVLALGWYYTGFGAVAAPLLACSAAAVCVAAIVLGRATGTAAALLVGTLLFSLLRLPTGNLWDALLDPLVWAWALGSVAVAVARMAAARKAGPLQPQAEPVPDLDLDLDPELVPAHAANIEQQL
jgi:hypothetical protein